jgi:ferritin
MLTAEVTKILQEQINKEFFSAYLYLEMANYYEKEGLPGFANWFLVQAQEERDHAMMFRQYLIDNDICVISQRLPNRIRFMRITERRSMKP